MAALGTLLLSTQASALGANTTTSVRCWHKKSSSSTILDFNARQLTMLSALRTKWGSTLNLKLLDVNAKVADMLANPATYNITNTTDSCLDLTASNTTNYITSHPVRAANNAYGKACTNADAFLFWDLLHPSTRSHKVIGDLATSLATALPKFPL